MSKKQPTLSLDREDLDAQLELAAQKRKKQKRKKVIIRVIAIGAVLVVVLAIVGVIVGVIMAGKAKSQMVNVTHATTAELTQEVKINGTVQSENVQHFYSPAPIKVESVVPVGTLVKKGEPIIKFDKESYEVALKSVELNDKITSNNYQSSVNNNNNSLSKLAQAQADVAKYQKEVDERQAKVDNYDEKGTLNQFNKNVQTQIALEQGNIKAYEKQIEDLWVAYKLQVGYDNLTQGEAEQAQINFEQRADVIELRSKIKYCNDVIKNVSGQLGDQQESLAEAKANLQESKSKLEAAKSQVESYKQASGNTYDRENLKLQGELNTLKSGNEYDEICKYENGCLIAPFDGIVTASFVSDGMTTSAISGTEIITFASIEDVSISISVSKKDLAKIKEGQKVTVTILDKDYEGEVTRIARMAVNSGSTSSVTAVIKVKNPDDSIYLGIEAKNVIITAHEDSCLQIPSEAINVDSEGYFVYIVNDMNVVEKRRVEIGISSESFTQVKEGITEDDRIVSFVTSSVIEGATVVPVDEDQMNSLIGGIDDSAVTVTTEVAD